jgi:PKD repeat protein
MKRLLVILLLLCPLLLSGCVLDTILSDVVNMAPKAVISATPNEGSAPLTVNFNAAYSHDDDGRIAEYRWDFGDPAAVGTGTQAACDHTYKNPGTYLAKLTVIDDEGSIGTQQIAVVVTNSPPVAVASVSNENPMPGNKVTFNGTASSDLQGAIAGTGATAEHTYIEGGYYVVTLTVADSDGATASVHLGINVMPGESKCGGGTTCGGTTIRPLAIITMIGITSCSGGTVGVPITFDGTYSQPGVGNIVAYHWDFGDGTTASGAIVSHAYSQQWAYTVTLTVTDSGGGIATATAGCSIGSSSSCH